MKVFLASIALLLSTGAYADTICYHFNGSSMVPGPCPITSATPVPTPSPTPVPTPSPTPSPTPVPTPIVTTQVGALGELDDTLTSPALKERAVLPLPSPADKTLFKEIVPCRLTDTRTGAGPFIQNEPRTYEFLTLPTTNPCFGKIEMGTVALTLQLTAYTDGVQVGEFLFNTAYVPQAYSTRQNTTAFLFYEDVASSIQAGTVAVSGSTFQVWNRGGVSNLTIDILGYHVTDTFVGTAGAQGQIGPKGDKGDKGDSVQGPPGVCSCPWACYSTCGTHAADTGRTALWPHCTVTLTGTQVIEIHYVSDGAQAVAARAKNAGSVTFSADTNSTYCVLTLADPQN